MTVAQPWLSSSDSPKSGANSLSDADYIKRLESQKEYLLDALLLVRDQLDGKLPPKEWIETERFVRTVISSISAT